MKKILFILLFFLNVVNAKSLIKLGAIPGSDAQIAEEVKRIAKIKYGLEIKIFDMSNSHHLNAALDAGDIDAHAVQSRPFFEEQLKVRNYKIIAVSNTYATPMGIFSNKINNLNDLKEGSKIGIPNNPINTGRSLILLQKAGIIKLKNENNVLATVFDIVENPKKVKIIELEIGQLPRSLNDLDIATINISYAVGGGLKVENALITEAKDSHFINNVFVVQEKNKNQIWVKHLIETYHSEEVAKFINKTFKGAIIPIRTN